MKNTKLLNILFICGLISSIFIPIFYSQKMKYDEIESNKSYLIKKTIPGIVEGTALMVDTDSYFEDFKLTSISTNVNIECQDPTNLKITIGYKNPNLNLFELPKESKKSSLKNNYKEIDLWMGNNKFPSESYVHNYYDNKGYGGSNKIDITWDLKSIGFSENEYINAEKRIWFLKISAIDKNLLKQSIIEEVILENGSKISYSDTFSESMILENFEIDFGGLIFETQLHPVFDGSNEVIIPIRGVNHELKTSKTKSNDSSGVKSYTTILPSYSTTNNKWLAIFATCEYRNGDDLRTPSSEACAYMLGIDETGHESWQYHGMLDYGWKIVYCMDKHETIDLPTGITTVDRTDDNYFHNMIDYVTDQVEANDQLQIIVLGHGTEKNNEHASVTGKTRLYFKSDVIKLSEYKAHIAPITSDGTYVFLYVKCCNGDDVPNNWLTTEHNYKLDIWGAHPEAQQDGPASDWDGFNLDEGTDIKPLGNLMKNSFEGLHVSEIGAEFITHTYTYGLIITDDPYWGSYEFRVGSDYHFDDFTNFAQYQYSNDIISSKTSSNIQFEYTNSIPDMSYSTESYFTTFSIFEHFIVEIEVDWLVNSYRTIWGARLYVGAYTSGVFTTLAYTGIWDAWAANSGYYISYYNNIHYYGNPALSSTNVIFRIEKYGNNLICSIVQSETILYQNSYTTGTSYINSLLIWYHHHNYYFDGTSEFDVDGISFIGWN